MSEFNDLMDNGLQETEDISGAEEFTLSGKTYRGILSQFSREHDSQVGSNYPMSAATLVCRLEQFSRLTKPLHKTLCGKVITVDSSSYRIDRVEVDSAGVTLSLSNVQ